MSKNIEIVIVGDIFPAELAYTIGYGIRSQFEKHKGKAWINQVKQITGKNDLIIANLESPLLLNKNAEKKTFYGNPDFTEFLRDCGINVLNIANNHILEHGPQGFKSTIDSLSEKDLDVIGFIENGRSKILYRIINGIKIAIAGFSNVDLYKINNEGYFPELNEINVLETIDRMKKESADIKVLCFHWGNEYIHIPSLEQRQMAYKFIDAGADIIAGHHPHVIQPYEQYNQGHIFYSLGNFMFDYLHSKMVSIGMTAKIKISRSEIINVQHKGIKLSYKYLLDIMPTQKYNRYYRVINRKYDIIRNKPDYFYDRYYRKILCRNHVLQRIFMKTAIVKEFINIGHKNRKILINNFLQYYGNKFNRNV